MSEIDNPRQNQLLAMLPEPGYAHVASLLERVELCCGDVLSEAWDALRYVYFPVSGVIAKLYFNEHGSSSELALIGREGMLGAAALMGSETLPHQALVVMPGYAYRLHRNLFEQEISRIDGQVLNGIVRRYTQALVTHMTQIAACNRHHSIEQQFSRWLLMILDRQSDSEIVITQQSIASLLGVSREGITEAAGKLQQAGVIRYCRGHISVQERAALEVQSCECYQLIKTEFGRLMAVSANPSPQAKPISAMSTYGHVKDLRRRYSFGG